MKITQTFQKIAKAYIKGYKYIINKGGSRSGKTFAILQLLETIARESKKRLVIHVVSHSTPHLKDGAIADFENILLSLGYNIDDIRTQNPHTYRIGNSIIKFIGFDKLGKALGAARNILFVNECNKMDWRIVHQLMQRTTDCVFFDYNPTHEFWIDTEGISKRPNAFTTHTTFIDNWDNLSPMQVEEFKEGKRKHDLDVQNSVTGYWYNWWRVYGLGLEGQIEGAIFTNWKQGDWDDTLPSIYGLDWGITHPFALVEVAIDEKSKRIYVRQKCYKTGLGTDEILATLEERVGMKATIIADSADKRGIRDVRLKGFNIFPAFKPVVVSRIRQMMSYQIIVCDSPEIEHELKNYVWLDRTGDVPIDDHNHALDAIGYAFVFLKRNLF